MVTELQPVTVLKGAPDGVVEQDFGEGALANITRPHHHTHGAPVGASLAVRL